MRKTGINKVLKQYNKSKVRVLALVAEAFGGRGGIAQSTRDLMLALSSLPEVANIDILPRLQPEPTVCFPAGVRQFSAHRSRLAYALQALWHGAKLKPDIVYCGHAFMAPLALMVARMTGARLLCHVHGLEVWQPLSIAKRRALASYDIVLCVSNYTARKFVEVTGIDPDRCKVIYNTFDERFTPGNKLSARKKFNLPSNSVVLSTVSRLDPNQRHKGHDRVIPLLRDLAGVHPNLIYLIAGTGGDQTRLEELAHDTGAANIVQFLGFVSDENLPDLYRASDLYVMPSHGEGFGIAFVEAMACGTLALGLDQGGAGDALRNGELGIAVREADFPNALRTSLDTATSKISDISERTNNIFARDQFTCRVKSEIKWLMQN